MERTELQNKVTAVLEQIRPYLQQDGGDLKFVELTDDNVVKVQLTGACGSCPHAVFTLKQGVEQAVKKAVPEIKSVESV
jgi:Fe-S cluster biogenesis protein NfuA